MTLAWLPIINIILACIVMYQTSTCTIKYFHNDRLMFYIFNPMPFVSIGFIILHAMSIAKLFIYNSAGANFVSWQVADLFAFLFIARLISVLGRCENEKTS